MSIEDMKDKEYRHGMVAAQIEVDLPLQIRALRKEREWTQPHLAGVAEMRQARISVMEKPGGANFTLDTLRRMAKAFDVALIVRFAPFSELVRWSDNFSPDQFSVPSFEDDAGLIDKKSAMSEGGLGEQILTGTHGSFQQKPSGARVPSGKVVAIDAAKSVNTNELSAGV